MYLIACHPCKKIDNNLEIGDVLRTCFDLAAADSARVSVTVLAVAVTVRFLSSTFLATALSVEAMSPPTTIDDWASFLNKQVTFCKFTSHNILEYV